MSNFDARATGRETSRPVEIYEIDLDGTFYRYTNAEDELTVASQIYTPAAISRTRPRQGSDDRNADLKITLPASDPFATLYSEIPPGRKATIRIWQLERDESPSFDTQVLLFKGQLLSVQFSNQGYTAVLNCRAIHFALNRPIPRFTYRAQCNHVLYDAGCGVDPGLFNVTGAVTDVTGSVITLPGANAEADGYYTGGYCTPTTGDTDFRLIIDHTGNQLTLNIPFATDVTGISVQAFAGCDHNVEGDCALLFDNVINFGGFFLVPLKNIFIDGLD